MYLVLGIFIITTLIVYVVRKLDIEHSWTVAWASGILFEAIGLTAGYILLGISDKIAGVIIGSVISGVIAMIIQFLFFNLDYSRTERLQFEDDDYYYYVKAVPKSLVTEKDKQIKRFNGKNEKERLNKKKFAEEMDIDENLLKGSESGAEFRRNIADVLGKSGVLPDTSDVPHRYYRDHYHFSSDLLYAGLDQRYESVDASPWNPCDPCLCFACSFV